MYLHWCLSRIPCCYGLIPYAVCVCALHSLVWLGISQFMLALGVSEVLTGVLKMINTVHRLVLVCGAPILNAFPFKNVQRMPLRVYCTEGERGLFLLFYHRLHFHNPEEFCSAVICVTLGQVYEEALLGLIRVLRLFSLVWVCSSSSAGEVRHHHHLLRPVNQGTRKHLPHYLSFCKDFRIIIPANQAISLIQVIKFDKCPHRKEKWQIRFL